MADVIGLSDVSTPDTGEGSEKKTGNLKRSYNMANKCVSQLMSQGVGRSKAVSMCTKHAIKKGAKKASGKIRYAGRQIKRRIQGD